jgi:hypothetical protein
MPPEIAMPVRIERALKRTADVLAQDAHTCEPPLTDKDCIDMAADCYLEMYGKDTEAVKAFRNLPEKEQDKILKKLKKGR